MNIVFWIIILMLCSLLYFILSFTFNGIGNIALKMYKKFKNNIKEEGEKNNEK